MARFVDNCGSGGVFCYSEFREEKVMRQKHYWIVAEEEGKPYLIYGGITEEAARQKGMEMMSGLGLDFTIKMFPTRNLDSARSMLYGRRADGQRQLGEATKRQGHEKSINRLAKKRKTRRWFP